MRGKEVRGKGVEKGENLSIEEYSIRKPATW